MKEIESVADRISAVEAKITAACVRAKRKREDIRVVGVSKLQPAEKVRSAVSAGLSNLGENYVQELLSKQFELKAQKIHWHFIGPLQTNKVKSIIGKVELIHTLDRESLALEISKCASKAGIIQNCLLQVNIACEDTKSGCAPNIAKTLLEKFSNMKGLRVSGLMVMPPLSESPEISRPHFRRTGDLLAEINSDRGGRDALTLLSMGTSQDFEVAIEEGATHIRVGTTIFGERGY